MSEPMPPLSPTEARVVAVLIEKEKTTPDVYPLSANALTTGCNQKTSRDPVLNLRESEVLDALDSLRQREIIRENSGSRVLRYSHNFGRSYGTPAAATALLAMLMLRGPQTVSELRANCERLYPFSDSSSVEGYLEELAARSQPLALRLPKQPGSREHRWCHLVCGAPAIPPESQDSAAPAPQRDSLAARVSQLEEQVQSLQQDMAALRALLQSPDGN
ncbi:MAG: hypothetical protein RIR00_2265 [Pseudomonadota bacterium]|jgi:uncharacterized protein YceH (UPF0502 family)